MAAFGKPLHLERQANLVGVETENCPWLKREQDVRSPPDGFWAALWALRVCDAPLAILNAASCCSWSPNVVSDNASLVITADNGHNLSRSPFCLKRA